MEPGGSSQQTCGRRGISAVPPECAHVLGWGAVAPGRPVGCSPECGSGAFRTARCADSNAVFQTGVGGGHV